ncbi:MAG: hypothetical protein ACJ748_16140 [Flavisolibacter sp.]
MDPKNINDELRDLNSDLPSPKMPFTVPEGYFEGLSDAILMKVREQGSNTSLEEITQLSPLLAGISRKMPNYIPENYFQSALDDIPLLISDKEGSPILDLIGRSMPFTVPADYFQNLPAAIMNKVSGKQAKVISIKRHNWSRFLVAASVIAIMVFGGIFYFNNKSSAKDPIAQVKKLSTTEITDFLKNTTIDLNTNNVTAKNPSKMNDVKNLLQDVPDNELDNFLKQVPSEEDDMTIN